MKAIVFLAVLGSFFRVQYGCGRDKPDLKRPSGPQDGKVIKRENTTCLFNCFPWRVLLRYWDLFVGEDLWLHGGEAWNRLANKGLTFEPVFSTVNQPSTRVIWPWKTTLTSLPVFVRLSVLEPSFIISVAAVQCLQTWHPHVTISVASKHVSAAQHCPGLRSVYTALTNPLLCQSSSAVVLKTQTYFFQCTVSLDQTRPVLATMWSHKSYQLFTEKWHRSYSNYTYFIDLAGEREEIITRPQDIKDRLHRHSTIHY